MCKRTLTCRCLYVFINVLLVYYVMLVVRSSQSLPMVYRYGISVPRYVLVRPNTGYTRFFCTSMCMWLCARPVVMHMIYYYTYIMYDCTYMYIIDLLYTRRHVYYNLLYLCYTVLVCSC